MDVAPFLTKRIVDYHFQNGLTPIVVYPETMSVSKFDPPVRVRYLLNYDDLLFKNEGLENEDYLLFYSKAIADRVTVSVQHRTIFLPVSDSVFYRPPNPSVVRSGGVYYAGKYKYHFGGQTFSITDGMVEITRDRPDSQTPEQIRALFQQCEFFYCYEDSALALEAILCGCPTVFLPNEYFKKPLGDKELAGLGYAVGTSAEQLQHARDTVVEARERYLNTLEGVNGLVSIFIDETQLIAASRQYLIPFARKYIVGPGLIQLFIDMLRFMSDVISDKGFMGTLKIIAKRISAGRLRITS